MEFEYYIRIFRKSLWLILAAAFVGAGVSFILTTQQVPLYSAQVQISIGQYIQDPNPTSSQIYVGQNLVATYQQLVKTRDVLQGVVDALNLDLPPEALRAFITTTVVPSTSLLNIRVTYRDPVLTADIANEVANQLIVHSPTNLTADQQTQVDFAKSQMESLNQQVNDQRALRLQLDQQIAASTDAAEIQSLRDQESTILSQIKQAVSAIAQFQTSISGFQQRTNALTIVDSAVFPNSAENGRSSSLLLIGGAAGAALAIGVVLLLDYFDDKIRTSEVAAQLLSLPVLGAIPHFGKKKADYGERLLTNYPSMSEMMEAYRRLRTNLVYATHNTNEKVIVVTSCGPGEGKSVTSANLAATMAFSGMRVLLVDADMRRPVVHEIFGLENSIGLTTLLLVDPKSYDNAETQDADIQMPRKLDQCLQPTQIPNLKVITSGFIPANPAEILGSALMKRWIEAFRASSNVDVIIFDTPPILMFSDSATLAALTNAGVILVIDGEKTRQSAALKARDQLDQVGVDVKGIVINQVNMRDEVSYYSDYYYKSYYTRDTSDAKRGFWERAIPARLRRRADS